MAQAAVRETLGEHSTGEGVLGVLQPVSLHTSESEKGGKSLRRDKNVSTLVAI